MSTTISHDLYKTGYTGINSAGDRTAKTGQKGKTSAEGKSGYNSGISVEFSQKGMEALEESNKRSAVEDKNEQTIQSSEYKLPSKAHGYLDNLRKQYGDYDFIIADKGDDFKSLVKQSDKEFSVVFSSAELERMASDGKYASEKLSQVQTAVKMSDKINEQFGFERAWGKDIGNGFTLSKMAVSFDDDGKMSIFAEFEKASEKQNERLERIREKRAEEKAAVEKKAEEKQAERTDEKPVRKVQIEAQSTDDLWEKIQKYNWKEDK